jgi:hypothetical protein
MLCSPAILLYRLVYRTGNVQLDPIHAGGGLNGNRDTGPATIQMATSYGTTLDPYTSVLIALHTINEGHLDEALSYLNRPELCGTTVNLNRESEG